MNTQSIFNIRIYELTMQSETSYPAIIGRILEYLRKEAGLDQDVIAKRLGLTQSAWSRIERGQSGISMEQLLRVSDVLGTEPHKIIADADSASLKLKEDGIIIHPNIISKPDKAIAMLGLAALGLMIVAIIAKK